MIRLLLVRHATTAETRRARFPATTGAAACEECPPLDTGGHRAAAALAAPLVGADRAWCSLARRASESAAAAGYPDADARATLAELDFGAWAGLGLGEVAERDPAGLQGWLADPEQAPHGGERLSAARQRAAEVLAAAAAAGGTTVAFTHGGLVRAALLAALDLPTPTLWQLDVACASVTELRADPASAAPRWRLTRLSWTPTLAPGTHEAGEHAGSTERPRAPVEELA